jgi:WD40 repeat protein
MREVDEVRRQRFEADRLAGNRAPLEDFLPAEEDDRYLATLEELVCIDLEFRWKGGEAPSVSEYVERFAPLAEVTPRLRGEQQYLRQRFGRSRPGRRIGRYQLQELAGNGAFAEVWRARDGDLKRDVAIKLAYPGLLQDAATLERVHREAQSAAQLRHPGITPVHEVGEHEGQPFIVSDFIHGPTLAELIRESPPPPVDAARLVARLADAVEYAHQCGVVHRDIKPGNVLMAENRPVLTDFGLARLQAAEAELTRHGEVLGTPSYMPPEQARGALDEVGERSDVYSLGAMLYELLCGRRPFEAESTATVVHAVLHLDPPAPRTLKPDLPADLETICLKAMAKEPERRYATAGALAADLRRFLNHEPIQARRHGPVGRAALWVRRNPALATTLAASLLAVLTVAAIGFVKVVEERDRFRHERDVAHANQFRALLGEADALIQAGGTDWHRRAMQNLRAAAAMGIGDRTRARELVVRAHGSLRPNFRVLETWNLGEVVRALAVSPDGRRVASVDAGGTLRVHDMHGGRVRVPSAAEVRSIAFHPDGRWLASGARDGTVVLWDGEQPVARFSTAAGVLALDFSPDGSLLAAARDDGPIDVLRVRGSGGLERERELAGHEGGTLCLDFGRDGLQLASGGRDSDVRVWDLGTGEAVHTAESAVNDVRSLVFPDRTTVVFTMWEHYGLSIFRLPQVVEYRNNIHEDGVAQILAERRGWLVTVSRDGTLGFWDESMRRLGSARGNWGGAVAAAASPTEDRVVASYADGRVRVWSTATSALSDFRNLGSMKNHFVPGTALLATAHGTIDHDRARPLRALRIPAGMVLPIWGLAASPDGQWLATAAHDGRIALWNVATHEWVRDFQERGEIGWCVAFSPDGRWVAGGTGGAVGVWERATGRKVAFFETGGRLTSSLAFHPHLPFLASTHRNGTLRLWDPEHARALGTLWQAPHGLHDLCFRPDGKLLAAGCEDGTVPVWSIDGVPAPETDPDRLLTEHVDAVWAVAFDGEGEYLASGSRQGVVVMRDADSLHVRTRIRGDFGVIRSLSFSQANRLLSVGVYGISRPSVTWDLQGLRDLLRTMDLDWD